MFARHRFRVSNIVPVQLLVTTAVTLAPRVVSSVFVVGQIVGGSDWQFRVVIIQITDSITSVTILIDQIRA